MRGHNRVARGTATGIVLAATLTAPAFAQDSQATSSGLIIPQVSFRSWSLDDSDAEGWQLVTPIDFTSTVQIAADQRLDLSVRAAYVISENETPGDRGRVETFTDTIAGATYTVDLTPEVQVFTTAEVNLNTGKDTLYGSQKNAIMDPDLVDMVRFGEGFNLNLSVGVTYLIPDTKWAVTGAIGYNERGDYVADGDIGENFDPGDQVTGLVRVQYLDDKIYGALSVQYFDEDTSTLGGFDYFNPGNQVEVNFEGTYILDDVQSVSAGLFWSTSGRNEYLGFTGNDIELIKESADGNGDYVFGQLAYSHVVTPDLGLTVAGTYGVRTENDYQPENDLFIPSRTYWSVSLSGNYVLDTATSLSGTLAYGQVNDDETVFTGENVYDTFTGVVSLTYAL